MVTEGSPKVPKKQAPFYHRKVARSGGSRYISVGNVLPKDWHIVKIRVQRLGDRVCVLELTKLD
uniref:Uncharacterized protein n=1 Tax=viral metagenome TaxID=1070528 RepID=A0A6M3LVK1_9ZZZZ